MSQGFFTGDPFSGEWSFTCVGAPQEGGEYNVPVAEIMKSPAALVDWIAHLNEKTWFDAKKFADFFTRFRKQNNLFGSL
jgi:hypothetical protein